MHHSAGKSRPSMKNSHLKETGRHHTSSELGKRLPEHDQKRFLTRGKQASVIKNQNKSIPKEGFLAIFAQRLSQKYEERKPSPREVIFISIPDHSMSIKHMLEQFNANMMNERTKEPTQVYQEVAILLKLGTEVMSVYRDATDHLLIIYFKRLKNESLDSQGHQFTVIQTHLSEFKDRLVEEYPNKLRLLMKDIAQYLNKNELLKKISNRGQNRHYFIFNPDYLGSAGKKTVSFKPNQRLYELNIEDLSMERFGTFGARNSVATITLPPLSFCLFFDFDFLRCSENNPIRMSFVEKSENVLKNEKGETFVLDQMDIANFIDYLNVHKKYCKLVEDMISTMKEKKRLFYFEEDPNYLFFDVEVMQAYIDDLRRSGGAAVEAWFSLKLMENKIIFYTAIQYQYKITNVLDLPPSLAKRLGWHDTSGRLLGLFAYHSQEEYSRLLSKIMVNDLAMMNVIR
jgi:hypothetical protein